MAGREKADYIIESIRKTAIERCAERIRKARESPDEGCLDEMNHDNAFQRCLPGKSGCDYCSFSLKESDCRSPASIYGIISRNRAAFKKV